MQYVQYKIAAGKITRLGLYACIVLYYITGKAWGLKNMLTLQQATVQQHTTNKTSSKKKYFHIAKQLYLHYFNLKPLILQQPALGNVIKDINGGGHRVTLIVRGPAKNYFFYKVRWPLYSCISRATATSLMVPKIYLLWTSVFSLHL